MINNRVVSFVLSAIVFGAERVYAQETEVNAVSAETVGENPQNLKEVAMQQVDTAKHLFDLLVEFIVKYSLQALGGLIVLFLGWLVARYVANIIIKFFQKKGFDVTVTKFAAGGVKLLIISFALIVALGKFGIEIAPLIAGISVIGFGTSFALQGPLSNYASGVALIFTKPFKVGDIIEVAGVVGQVEDMKLPRTEIRTVDGHMIVIPNRHIVGEIIHNYSTAKRMDLLIGVSYDTNMEQAIKIIRDAIEADTRVLKAKPLKVGISEFGDSSVNIMARLFCDQGDYWDVLFDLNKTIFDTFNAQGVVIPFPQRDVHIINKTGFLES